MSKSSRFTSAKLAFLPICEEPRMSYFIALALLVAFVLVLVESKSSVASVLWL